MESCSLSKTAALRSTSEWVAGSSVWLPTRGTLQPEIRCAMLVRLPLILIESSVWLPTRGPNCFKLLWFHNVVVKFVVVSHTGDSILFYVVHSIVCFFLLYRYYFKCFFEIVLGLCNRLHNEWGCLTLSYGGYATICRSRCCRCQNKKKYIQI